MSRRTIIAFASATMMFASTSLPAAAVPLISLPLMDDGGISQDVSHWVKKCKTVRVKTAYGWKSVKKCKKVWPKHQSNAY